MDRIPTTNGGALGSGWETVAGPMAGMRAGRFREREVWVAPETPHPYPGQKHGRGSGVAQVDCSTVNPFGTATGVACSSGLWGATATPQPRTVGFDPARQPLPAFRPPAGPRTGQGPLGIALESSTEPRGTSSGAFAAGDVRERHGRSLPEPSPTTGYRPIWAAFVRWCGDHNAQHWPASPETVADYLRHRAKRCRIETVYKTKNAISSTHRRAGWGELFAGGIVAATLAELSSIKGEGRFRSRSVSGSSLRVAEMDKIRRTALEPRRRGGGLETPEYATRRGRVDLALCSLVLEAGLGVEQAAALEWQDLAVDANERPTIKIRRGSPGAGKIIEISKRAHDDLRTIAPKGAGTGKWIFGLNAIQIASRIRAAAQVAGIETRIESAAPRQGAHGVTAVSSTNSAPLHTGHWRAFCGWCDGRGAAHLPARAETVAAYLKEASQSRKLDAINGRLYAIRDAHLWAGYDDPCATSLVQATMCDIRQAASGFTPKSLNPATLEAIRFTATMPRLSARGRESDALAVKRGPVDIALCSVVYAAQLSVFQAAALKWRDVEVHGEDEATLTVKSGTDDHGSAECREIAGQAVRDLEAIRGDARPEDSVFGLTFPKSVYRRISEAMKHAGLVAGGEPSTASPSQTAPADLWDAPTADPWQTFTEGPPPIS